MHISEQIAAELINQGFEQINGDFHKTVNTNGAFGKSLIIVRIDPAGRWLERIDGWNNVECDIDLRNFDNASSAISALINH